MKLLVCAECNSYLSPLPTAGEWRSCDCERAQVRWLDPVAGRLEVRAYDLNMIRVLGLHNGMLQAAFHGLRGVDEAADQRWRQAHRDACDSADGYLFHAGRRDCWALIVARNESSDVVWTQR